MFAGTGRACFSIQHDTEALLLLETSQNPATHTRDHLGWLPQPPRTHFKVSVHRTAHAWGLAASNSCDC